LIDLDGMMCGLGGVMATIIMRVQERNCTYNCDRSNPLNVLNLERDRQTDGSHIIRMEIGGKKRVTKSNSATSVLVALALASDVQRVR